MKILTVDQIQKADAATLQSQGISSAALMDRAAEAFAARFSQLYPQSMGASIALLCGPGNNGGDGLAVARLLFAGGYHPHVFIVAEQEKRSADFTVQLLRLKAIDSIACQVLDKASAFQTWLEQRKHEPVVLIDALFGIGLNQSPDGLFAKVIELVNMSKRPVVSIDIPSGLFADKSSVKQHNYIVKATYTLTFEGPKLAFLFPENAPYLGAWEILSIGIDQAYLDEVDAKNHFLLRQEARLLLKQRSAFSHKGTFGHALIVAGSEGMVGAAVLAASACMRSGAGKLTAHLPGNYCAIMHTVLPEAMTEPDPSGTTVSLLPLNHNYHAAGIGPGIGTAPETIGALKLFIQTYKGPLVLDADAINILSEQKTWLAFLAPNTVLTPHPKEFERLVGKWDNDFEKHQLIVNFAVKFRVCVVLKGAFTCIAFPDGSTSFNTTGNPGMATAGAGDVLCGLITGLLAQGYSSASACMLGVYLHGLAGDLAAADRSQEALLAGDIIAYLGQAFLELRKVPEVDGVD